MISKQEAMSLHYGQVLGMISYRDNRIIHVRVSGACKTWKTRPNDFRLPVRFGLYENGAIEPGNAWRFFMTTDEAKAYKDTNL